MGKRTEKQEKRRLEKRTRKAATMGRPGQRSRYARKREYLQSHRWNPEEDDMPAGRKSRRLFGFEVPEPKPWK